MGHVDLARYHLGKLLETVLLWRSRGGPAPEEFDERWHGAVAVIDRLAEHQTEPEASRLASIAKVIREANPPKLSRRLLRGLLCALPRVPKGGRIHGAQMTAAAVAFEELAATRGDRRPVLAALVAMDHGGSWAASLAGMQLNVLTPHAEPPETETLLRYAREWREMAAQVSCGTKGCPACKGKPQALPEGHRVETWSVLAGAYEGGFKRRAFPADAAKAGVEPTRMLRHSVELDAQDTPVRVLGGKCVALDSLTAGGVDDAEIAALPTCPKCLAKDPRRTR